MQHSPKTVTLLREVLGAQVAKAEDVITCTSISSSSCKIESGTFLIAFGEPSVRNDTAKVQMFTAASTREARMPIAQRDELLVLVRRGQAWELIERRLLRTS
jgi:hypothetical protein